jgi:organic hydroperoxide reductase OsmC/OhrA
MARTHHYEALITWTPDGDAGTTGYRDYVRDHDIAGVGTSGKPTIPGTADPAFRGEADRWNPEELLVVSLSQCHMLWYLALCAQAGVVVTGYRDRPTGIMAETPTGSGSFTEVTLRPEVTVSAPAHLYAAAALHRRAHAMCFIANSVKFPVHHEPTITVG